MCSDWRTSVQNEENSPLIYKVWSIYFIMNDMVAEANFVATVIILSWKKNYGIILIFEIFNFDNSVNFFSESFVVTLLCMLNLWLSHCCMNKCIYICILWFFKLIKIITNCFVCTFHRVWKTAVYDWNCLFCNGFALWVSVLLPV